MSRESNLDGQGSSPITQLIDFSLSVGFVALGSAG